MQTSNNINFIPFPDLSNANEDGLLAMGGDLSQDTLVSAYAQGIFPWFNHGQPILWWSPNPRAVLFPEDFKLTRSLTKRLRHGGFEVDINNHFDHVIHRCATRGQSLDKVETWITPEMAQAYTHLHKQGYAHSIEVKLENKLVGGLYGVKLGKVFFGESMFSEHRDASKVALYALCHFMKSNGDELIDCQIASTHLNSLGATDIPRGEFLAHLETIDIHQASREFASSFKQYWLDNDITVL